MDDSHAGARRHGRPRSWLFVAVFVAVFCAGGVALIMGLTALLWACAGLLIVLLPLGKAIGIMDDTVTYPTDPEEPGHG